jgi:hypothetical protein
MKKSGLGIKIIIFAVRRPIVHDRARLLNKMAVNTCVDLTTLLLVNSTFTQLYYTS